MKYQSKVKQEMKSKGYLVINLIMLSVAGFPDLLCIKDGKCTFIECKEGGDKLSPLQRQKIELLRRYGCIAYCQHKEKGIIY